jgi:hypothetical protein
VVESFHTHLLKKQLFNIENADNYFSTLFNDGYLGYKKQDFPQH